MNPIIEQMLWYALTMILTLAMMDMILQGFFHKFTKVFGSLGRLCFIKIRHTTYDGLAIGKEDEGFLVFKYKNKDYRLPINSAEKLFYRFLFVQWVDVDGEKWAISKTDYTPVSGFDPVKIQNFIKRILMMPSEDDQFKKIMYISIVILGVLLIACLIFNFTLMQKIDSINNNILPLLQQLAKPATITPATI